MVIKEGTVGSVQLAELGHVVKIHMRYCCLLFPILVCMFVDEGL